jgi:enterobacterial common antigen flippase
MIPISVPENAKPITVPCASASAGTALDLDTPPPATSAPPLRIVTAAKNSYGEILKSSALIGGSQVANIVIGIVRTKAMAVLLGPSGFGLFGVYASIQNLTQNIASMGINTSGVRQIAASAGSGDKDRVAQTAAVLRRTAFVIGLLGAALLLGFSRQVSQISFGNTQQTAAVSLLSLAVFFNLVSGGQTALIQGMRRIADLATINILGAFFGLCTSIPLVYLLGADGVVPSLVAVAAMTILTSWWYSRKIPVERVTVTLSQVRQETSSLLKLGSAFMASSMMTLGVAYFVRVVVLREAGFEAAGLYQSAWTLGGMYVGLILQAMGADFYPRLTASITNHEECNRLVNEQTLVGLLIAGPGVLATLTCAPLVIALLYSAKFGAAVDVLRWICLGATLQVITWPMGFIIIAKGRSALLFAAELVWTVVALALSWFCVKRYGLAGAGIAFFGSYIFHWILINPIARRLTGFHWSTRNRRVGSLYLSVIALLFGSFYVLPGMWPAALGILLTIASTVYSARFLLVLVPLDTIPSALRGPVGVIMRFPGARQWFRSTEIRRRCGVPL